MAIKCRIWWDERMQGYCMTASFNPKLVEALKTLIPSGDRDIDMQTKTWYVKEAYGEMLRKLAETCFGIGAVSFTSRTVAEQSQQRTFGSNRGTYMTPSVGTTEDAVVAFMNLVPYDAAKKCFREAMTTMHPDKGGDPTKAAKLNELWQRIEKEFYKR